MSHPNSTSLKTPESISQTVERKVRRSRRFLGSLGSPPNCAITTRPFSPILFCIALAAWLGFTTLQSVAASRRSQPLKPNIIFIMADDLGWGDLGCYGQQLMNTPKLDRMASEGIRFTDYYAGSTVCAPSRCALMTGLHTGHARIRGNGGIPLAPSDVTVAEVAKQAGYVTGVIGKWGLGEAGSTGIPSLQGFDEFAGFLNQKRAHNHYPATIWRNEETVNYSQNENGKRGLYIHYQFTDAAINFIKLNQKKRFFLYLPYTIPHKQVIAPTTKPYQDDPWPEPQKMLAAMIYRLDRDVGKILDTLQELKLDEKTLIFFTSDNGPHNQEGVKPGFFKSAGPFRGIKRDLYEGGIRAPMIVRWPGKIEMGKVSDQILAAWDFLPTVAELVGLKPPDDLDGISFLPTLLGNRQRKKHDFLYWEFHERGFSQAIRMDRWKAVRKRPNGPLELFDLKNDPGETTDVADGNRRTIRRLQRALDSARTPSVNWPIPALD